jgi:hypothetical protein
MPTVTSTAQNHQIAVKLTTGHKTVDLHEIWWYILALLLIYLIGFKSSLLISFATLAADRYSYDIPTHLPG